MMRNITAEWRSLWPGRGSLSLLNIGALWAVIRVGAQMKFCPPFLYLLCDIF